MGLKNLENLKFVDANPEEMEIHILDIVEGLLERKLARADPLRLFLLGVEALLIQQRLLLWVATQLRERSERNKNPPAMRVEDKKLYKKHLSRSY